MCFLNPVVAEEPLQESEESVLKAGLLNPLKTWPQVVFIRMANSYLKEFRNLLNRPSSALRFHWDSLEQLSFIVYKCQKERFPRSRRCGWN